MPSTFPEYVSCYFLVALVFFLVLWGVSALLKRPQGVPGISAWEAFWLAVLWPLTAIALFMVFLVAVLFGV